MKLGYMGSYFFIQLVHAGAALGGVIIGVQQIQLWGTGWVRWDDEAQASFGGVHQVLDLPHERRPMAGVS
jgi:hypothetical protein